MNATEDLAKGIAHYVLESHGYTTSMVDQMWENDPEGRQPFLDLATVHVHRILAEGLRENDG